ncbi:MAG: hypothetical protein BWX80_01246 [Candidatus Hydrogenedentes bacterium ADurb.Bin101]|nr:MAG: hypothetical protein BWX80_01246 [Candidatus Hydrogenedentes bacterium ADurb.Bin101]
MPCFKVHGCNPLAHVLADAATAPEERVGVYNTRAHDAPLTGQHFKQPGLALSCGELFNCLDKSAPPVGDKDIVRDQIISQPRGLYKAPAYGEKRAQAAVGWIEFGRLQGCFLDLPGLHHALCLFKGDGNIDILGHRAECFLFLGNAGADKHHFYVRTQFMMHNVRCSGHGDTMGASASTSAG